MNIDISSLKKLAGRLAEKSVDISHAVAFLEYLESHPDKFSDGDLILDEEFMTVLAPLMDYGSISGVFARIIDGELDPALVKPLIPYAPWLVTQIESSVVLGALDADVLKLIREPDTAPGPQV